MARPLRLGSTLAAATLVAVGGLTVVPAEGPHHRHPRQLHQHQQAVPHGVGTRRAHGWHKIHFLRNKRKYWRAEKHNPDLDRDNDRIACEKA